MKKIIKFSLIVFISLISIQSYAQSYGLKVGLNLANLLYMDDDDTWSNDFKSNPGFHIGATVDVPLNDFLSFESGLLLTTKGTKYYDEGDETAKMSLIYLDIPLTVKASYDIGNGLKMFGIAGPYVGVGLSGKDKYIDNDGTDTESINWGSDENDDDLKRLDMGLSFGGGVEVSSFSIGISYDLGLANISPYQDNGSKINNRILKFSVGYKLGN